MPPVGTRGRGLRERGMHAPGRFVIMRSPGAAVVSSCLRVAPMKLPSFPSLAAAAAVAWRLLGARLSLRLLLLACFGFLGALAANPAGTPGPAIAVWIPDAVLLALALRARRRRVPAYLGVSFGAEFAGRLVAGDGGWYALGHAVANAACVIVPTLALRSSLAAPLVLGAARETRPPTLISGAVLGGIAVAAAFGAAVAGTRAGADYARIGLDWLVGDALGMVGLLPLGLALTHERLAELRRPGCAAELLAALLAVGACTLLGLRYAPFPFVMIELPLLLAALRLPLLGTTLVGAAETLLYAGLSIGGIAPGMHADGFAGGAHAFNAAMLLAPLVIAWLRHGRALDAERLRTVAVRSNGVLDGEGRGTWEWRPGSGEASYSPGWQALLGVTPVDAGAGIEVWIGRVHPEDVGRVLGSLEAHIDGEGSEFVCAHRVRAADGDWRWVKARGCIVERAADGAPLALFGTLTDIDAEIRAEAERIALAQRLRDRKSVV